MLAGELVVGRGVRGGRDDGAFGLPALHQAAGLRVAAVDRLLQVLERLLVLAERALLLRRAEERLAGALHALLAQVLVRGAVAQQLLGSGVVALGVEVLLLLHAGAGGINLAPSLEVALHTAVGLGGDDVVEELVHFGVGRLGSGGRGFRSGLFRGRLFGSGLLRGRGLFRGRLFSRLFGGRLLRGLGLFGSRLFRGGRLFSSRLFRGGRLFGWRRSFFGGGLCFRGLLLRGRRRLLRGRRRF